MKTTLLSSQQMADLRAMRDMLVPLWLQWGLENNKPVSEAGEGMCRFTAAFLVKAMGKGWRFDVGQPDVFDWAKGSWEKSPAGGGFLDAHGAWQAHYWVAKDGLIVDLTASQFNEEEILVVGPDHPLRGRFKSTMDRQARSEALQDVTQRAKGWAALWRADQASRATREAASNDIGGLKP